MISPRSYREKVARFLRLKAGVEMAMPRRVEKARCYRRRRLPHRSLSTVVKQHAIIWKELIEPIEFANVSGQHHLTLLHSLEI